MRKYYETTVGQKIYENTNLIGFQASASNEGFIFKDEDAFKNNPDEICYIPEHAWDDVEDEHGIMSPELAKKLGETRNTIRQQIKDAWGEDYMLTDEQIDYFAWDVFRIAEWACISTYLTENYVIEESIGFYCDDYEEDIFTKFQREAIINGMTPKEYSERSLSYEELIQFGEEFENAFIQDKDCSDDWSDKGLGDNALLTYIEERRTGVISGPDEFNCDNKWRKSTKQ